MSEQDQAFCGAVDYRTEIDMLRAENATLRKSQETVSHGVIRRKPRARKSPFGFRRYSDDQTKGSPQSAYSKAGRWTERGGTHQDFVSPFTDDQTAYWRRYWRALGIEE